MASQEPSHQIALASEQHRNENAVSFQMNGSAVADHTNRNGVADHLNGNALADHMNGSAVADPVNGIEHFGEANQRPRFLFCEAAPHHLTTTPQPLDLFTSATLNRLSNKIQPFQENKIYGKVYSNHTEKNTSAINLTSCRNPNPPDPSTVQDQPLSNQTTPECAPNEVVISPYGFYSGFDLLPNQLPILADPLQFGVLNRCQTRGEVEHQNYNHHPLNPAQPTNKYPDSLHRSPGASQQVTTLSSTVVPKNSQVETFLYNSNFWD